MLGDSSLLGSPGGGLAGEHDGGGAVGSNSNSGDEDKAGERSFGGNRWPRQETIALLKIRSDMDVAFREASVKGPLWDDVSRKLGELGYHRSAKKCKEKFENVYKYHKRTKEGRGGKPDGKTYRFFQQLEALETQPKPQTTPPAAAATTVSLANVPHSHPPPQVITVPTPAVIEPQIPSFQNADLLSNSSASTYSDEEAQGRRRKKRKWKDFFERLMKEVISKQEELQKRFMDAIEKREQERIAREEAWRMQEMTRISREREMLAQERSMAAAKDSAVMSFLQNVSQQQNPVKSNSIITTLPPPPPAPTQPPSVNTENGGAEVGTTGTPGSSRWPKVEVEALIQLRTNLDSKYQDNGPKGPLWEEISAGMRRLGYNRSSKRCKEKWENINKYFKKVKESNKKRPQDSKTCPYFHQLDALYRNKHNNNLNYITQSSFLSSDQTSAPMMVRPEQQWPPTDTNQPDIKLDGTDEDDEMEEDEEEGEDEFELVASKPPSMAAE